MLFELFVVVFFVLAEILTVFYLRKKRERSKGDQPRKILSFSDDGPNSLRRAYESFEYFERVNYPDENKQLFILTRDRQLRTMLQSKMGDNMNGMHFFHVIHKMMESIEQSLKDYPAYQPIIVTDDYFFAEYLSHDQNKSIRHYYILKGPEVPPMIGVEKIRVKIVV